MIKEKAFFVVVAFMSLSTVSAQEVTGNLEGRVVDSLGVPVPGVNVSVRGSNLQGLRGAASNSVGYFRVAALPVGEIIVTISSIGYQDMKFENVPIRLGQTSSLGEVRLASRDVELAEVVVSGGRPTIDPTSTTIGENLRSETIHALPTERNFRNIVTLIPSANASFFGDEANISGSTGTENVYFIDGVNVTDPFQAATSTNLPYNLIKEIEIKTGGYEAEYGRSLGGIVNIITNGGGNDFHGQLFGFFSNGFLGGERTSRPPWQTLHDFATYDIGVSLSGPIVNDQVWFFAAYNPTFEIEQIKLAGLGTYRDRTKSHVFSGKITWQADERTNVVLSMFGDPGKRDRVLVGSLNWGSPAKIENADLLLRTEDGGGSSFSLSARHIISERLFVEGSVSRLDRNTSNHPTTEVGQTEATSIDLVTGTWSGGRGVSEEYKSSRSAARVSTSLFLEKHILKAGFEYEDNALKSAQHIILMGSPIVRTGDSSYTVNYSYAGGVVHNRIPTVFVQDSWSLSTRLRINAGMRWESQYLIGSNGRTAQRIVGEWQPRVGLTYQLSELGSDKLFGSYGRFYEQIPLILAGTFYVENNVSLLIRYKQNPLTNPSFGDTLDFSRSSILPEVKNLHGQTFDEFTLGYETRVWTNFKLGVRGIYRTLRETIEDFVDPNAGYGILGNPGRGNLSFIPRLTRNYVAAEFTLQKSDKDPFNFVFSYVLSRNSGNYPGLYSSDFHVAWANISPLDLAEQLVNGTGALPNDRTHVLKFYGSYRFAFGLGAGTSFVWQSGTPLNNFGATEYGYPSFLQQRGTAGRMPTIWDLNVRLTYDLVQMPLSPRLILDAFHLFSQHQPVEVDQVHYFALDSNGNQASLNPAYGKATKFQPPMTVRLGIEIGF